jgi:hypothetical protein
VRVQWQGGCRRAASEGIEASAVTSLHLLITVLESMLRMQTEVLLYPGNPPHKGHVIIFRKKNASALCLLMIVAIHAASRRRLLCHIVFEIGVVASLLGRNATGGVVYEHHLQQIQAPFVEVGAERRFEVSLPLGEGRLEIGI